MSDIVEKEKEVRALLFNVPRRAFLAGAGATAFTLGVSTKATAAVAYNPGVSSLPVPSAAELHMLRRFTYGFTQEDFAALKSAGGADQWFARQLNPGTIPDSEAEDTINWWKSVNKTPAQLWQSEKDQSEPAWIAMTNYANWVIQRRMKSKRQLQEIMAEFWEDHLYIPIHDDGVSPFRAAYGKEIHRLALSSFEELLKTAITHPAMSCSLDNATSHKNSVNENLGRELLELHTVGQGNYSQNDVYQSSLVLTGWRVKMWSTFEDLYDTSYHYVGPVKVMGWSHANSSADGREACYSYLSYLARHPLTARRIARKLCLRFVSDSPSEILISHLAKVYLDNNTAIKPVLQALVASSEFKKSAGKKIKSPTDDTIGIYRAVGAKFSAPKSADSGAHALIWIAHSLGHPPFGWPRPDGPPQRNDAWDSPARYLASFDLHWGASGGWWPQAETNWKAIKDWYPSSTIKLKDLVDHLSRAILGEPSTSTLLQACCEATSYGPDTQITAQHPLASWWWPALLVTILDSPSNFLR